MKREKLNKRKKTVKLINSIAGVSGRKYKQNKYLPVKFNTERERKRREKLKQYKKWAIC